MGTGCSQDEWVMSSSGCRGWWQGSRWLRTRSGKQGGGGRRDHQVPRASLVVTTLHWQNTNAKIKIIGNFNYQNIKFLALAI